MFVFSNLATSLDGKIATPGRELFPIGTAEDRRHMQRLRKEADAVLFGAETLRRFQKPCTVQDPAWKGRQPMNVVLSSGLKGLSPAWPFFTRGGFRRVLLAGHDTPASRLRALDRSCEIFVLKKPSARLPVARQVLQILGAMGVERVLVEGGGGLMAEFVEHDLIDEYHVTLVPRLIGGTESPTLVDGRGFEPGQILNLKLVQCRPVGDELYLTYRKTGQRG